MRNAHLRMGRLEYIKAPVNSKSTPTHIIVWMDRAILVPPVEIGSSARCHLISVFGGDQEIAAIAAAISEEGRFTASGPGLAPTMITLGERAAIFRSAMAIPERKQPVKHLVAVSEELSQTQAGADTGAARTILYDGEPQFMSYRLGVRFGVPVLPEWGTWAAEELSRRKLIHELPGLGCCPVVVTADKKQLLEILGAGLRSGRIHIPDEAAIIRWKVRQSIEA
jgi:hypothetical protein